MTERDRIAAEATRRLVGTLLEEPDHHLDYETQLAPYVDGTLGAAEWLIVDSHAEECALCRAELDDLQRHAKRTKPRSNARWLALAAALAIAVTAMTLVPRKEAVAPAPAVIARKEPPRPVQSAPAYAKPEWTRLVATALAEGTLPPASLPGTAETDTLRGGGEARRLQLAPSGVVVETTRPTFTWPPASGASYAVAVFSDNREIASAEDLTEPRWTPARDLPRGRTYVWQVEVTRGEARTLLPSLPTPPPAFRILGQSEHGELEDARGRHGDDPLLLAVLTARHGLAGETAEQLARLDGSPDPRVQRLVRNARAALQDASPISTKAAQ